MKVSSGIQTSFLIDPLVGSILLGDMFPRFFLVLDYSRGSVGEVCIWFDGNLILKL